jgi:hypothetical protein
VRARGAAVVAESAFARPQFPACAAHRSTGMVPVAANWKDSAMLYRLYCGLTDRSGTALTPADDDEIVAEFGRHFPDGFTTWKADGYWQGSREPMRLFELSSPQSRTGGDNRRRVVNAARALALVGRQSAVLIVATADEATLVEHNGQTRPLLGDASTLIARDSDAL